MVKEDKPWVSALNIDPNEVMNWAAQVHPDESLTFWCLERGRVPTQPYLEWAKEHYGLAVLKDEYFKTKPNHQLWSQIQTVANWSPSMLPLEEWDGVIFIACVEPPFDVEWSFPVQYVLAPPRALKQRWKQLQKEEPQHSTAQLEATSPSNEAAPPPLPDFPEPPNPLEDPNIGREISSEELENNSQSEDFSDEESFAPEGINLSIKKTGGVLNEDSLIADLGDYDSNFNAPENEEENSENLAVPDNLLIDDTIELSEPKPKVDDKTEELSAVAEGNPDATEPLELEEMNGPEVEAVVKELRSQPEYDSDEAIQASSDSIINTDQIAPKTLAAAKDDNEVVAWIFNKLHQSFQSSMVLLFHNDKLQAWKWEVDWNPADKKALKPFSIDSASLFRIVKRTKLPYHGHVVKSDLNDWFFKAWGFSTLPQHVTATPLHVDNRHLLGILLSVGDTKARNHDALILSERMADEVVEALSKAQQKAA